MPKLIDLTGEKIGRLTIIKRIGTNKGGRPIWLCQCDCGNTANVSSHELRNGDTKSCGCLQKEQIIKAKSIHNGCKDRLYRIWRAMKERCKNPNNKDYHAYGGRGIEVCDEWINDYAAFREWALANGYDENAPFGECTIDRINVNKNYEPSNCRWADASTQSSNRRPWKKKKGENICQ